MATYNVTSDATLASAIAAVNAGDTINIAAGTYSTRHAFARSGTSGSRITVAGASGAIFSAGFTVSGSYYDFSELEVTPGTARSSYAEGHVICTGDYNIFTDLYIHDTGAKIGSGFQFGDGAQYCTLSDSTIARIGTSAYAGNGVSLQEYSASCTVSNVTISEFHGKCGIQLYGTSNLVEDCTIEGPSGTTTGYDGDGIDVKGASHTIRDCVIHDIFEDYADSQHTDIIQFWESTTGLVVERCVLGTWEPKLDPLGTYDNYGSQNLIVMQAKTGSTACDVTFRNNLILGNRSWSTDVDTDDCPNPITARFYNNIFWSAPMRLMGNTTSWVMRNNVFLYEPFRSGTYPPASIDSDYNCIVTPLTTGSLAYEGDNSFVADPAFVSVAAVYTPTLSQSSYYGSVVDVPGAATDYGMNDDYSPSAASPLVRAGTEDSYTSATNFDEDDWEDPGALTCSLGVPV